MRVLITGACGFVGRHFTRRMVREGHRVDGVDNLSSGLPPSEWMFPIASGIPVRFYYQDIRDWMREFDADGYDLIIHCAAIVGGRLKIDGDPLAVATDLSADSDLFNWIVRAKKKPKLVYFSSSAAYPIELQTRDTYLQLAEHLQPVSRFGELTRLGLPDQTYGWAKLNGEYLAQFAARQYGLDVVIYRPFGGYGEDQSFDYPFPSIIKRVLDNENPVVVWGSGEQKRDFIHIDDVVDCVLSTMDKLKPGEPLNIGSGIGTSFKELALRAAHLLGKDITVVNDATKPEGVFYRVSDPYKMQELWTPKISLDDGIMRVARALDGTKIPA